MSARQSPACKHHADTEALAAGNLPGAQKRAAQRHLENCKNCRDLFRRSVGDRYPRFPNYTIVERIGEGGFGVVYKAIHHAKQRTEALKVLFEKTPVRRAYFENEVHLIAKLRHPHIATLYDAHLTTPPMYYTMDFVEGRQLDDYFREAEPPFTQRLHLFLAVAQAIGYAHNQGVVHRDIKPQNILVDPDGYPHVVDFGIAKKLGLATSEDTDYDSGGPEGALGTFGYIAPEQLAGEHVDGRADIYALGALLFHCITGEPARYATRNEHVLDLLHHRHVTRAEDLAAIIARCISTAPEDRYPTAADLVDDLHRYLTGHTVNARLDRSISYRLKRGWSAALLNQPHAVRAGTTLLIVVCLVALFSTNKLRRYLPGGGLGDVSLIAFTPETLAAIPELAKELQLENVAPANRKSWRVLYGQLMQRLARAGPTAVAWDYYFPDCNPEYDHPFISGARALRNRDIPIVVGAAAYDVNSEPIICPDLRAAVSGCGALVSTRPDEDGDELLVPACIQRGYARPVPSLSTAMFAKARYPNSDPDLKIEPHGIQIRYRKQETAPGEPRWHQAADNLTLGQAEVLEEGQEHLEPGDRFVLARVPISDHKLDQMHLVPFHVVLRASTQELQQWFAGRSVIIGQTLPGIDQFRSPAGRDVWGCQVHVLAMQAMLRGEFVVPFEVYAIAVRVLCWSILGAWLGWRMPAVPARRIPMAETVCLALLPLILLSALVIAGHLFTRWLVELTMALVTILASGTGVYLIETLRRREDQLAPGPTWSTGDTTLSTTLLAETQSDQTRLSSAER